MAFWAEKSSALICAEVNVEAYMQMFDAPLSDLADQSGWWCEAKTGGPAVLRICFTEAHC